MTTTSLLDGIVTVPAAAAELGRHPITLRRWAARPGGPGLIYLGRTPYVDLTKLRRWIEAQERIVEPEPPIRRGRPRKAVS